MMRFEPNKNGWTDKIDLDDSATVFPVKRMALRAQDLDDDQSPIVAVATHEAIVRTDRMETVGVVSPRYGVLENREFFSVLQEAMQDAVPTDMRGGMQVREACTGNWAKREYVFPEYKATLAGTQHSTTFGLRIIASNSYDGSQSARITCGLIDFYCTNGIVSGKGLEMGARRHTGGISSQALVNPLKLGIENANRMVESIRHMAETPVTEDRVIEVLEDGFSGRRAAELLAQYRREVENRGQTVFALHSAMTHFASHQGDYAQRGEWNPRHLQGREDDVARVLSGRKFRSLLAAA